MTKSPTSMASESPSSSTGNGLVARDLEHRQIRARIAQHDLRRKFAMVGQGDLDVGHPLDDVVVGDDEAAGIDDHPRSQRVRDARIAALAAEELAKDRIVEQRIAGRLLDARGVDVDHRRPRLPDHRRERQMNLAGALRHGLVALGERRTKQQSENGDDRKTKQSAPREARPPLARRETGLVGRPQPADEALSCAGPESLPFASTSRSTNSITAIGALSPARKPAFITLR